MKNFIWRVIARIALYFRDDLITLAMRTPYSHLPGYMNRYWLFNAYEDRFGKQIKRKWWMVGLPSIRIHHILRADDDRHPHNHPWWNARSIVLLRGYTELRPGQQIHERNEGDTYTLDEKEYHMIASVPIDGAWTMFITWQYCGGWGFLVDGRHVMWKDYKAMFPNKAWASSEPTKAPGQVNIVSVINVEAPAGSEGRTVVADQILWHDKRPPGGWR